MDTTSQPNTTLRRLALERMTTVIRRRGAEAREMEYLEGKGVLTATFAEEYRMRLRLLDRAIYSFYLDCVDAGAGAQARQLLDDLRHSERCVPGAAR